MEFMKLIWQYLLAEPFSWIFYSFFQPARFVREFERRDLFLRGRFVPMLRLIFPVFVVSYPLALVGHFIIFKISFVQTSNLINLLLVTSIYNAIGIILGLMIILRLGVTLGIVLGITLGIVIGATAGFKVGMITIIAIGITLGLAVGLTGSTVISIGSNFIDDQNMIIKSSILLSVIGGIAYGVIISILNDIFAGTIGGFTFVGSAFLFFFRIMFYPLSSISLLRAYRNSLKNPTKVFTYLRRSSLYWDECIYLHLPKLTKTLLIALAQDVDQTLKEITFIAVERPHQIQAARRVILEFLLNDLEMPKNITEITHASENFARFLDQEADLVDLRWITPLKYINFICMDAMRFCNSVNKQSRRQALDDMMTNLRKIHSPTITKDVQLRKRFEQVIANWQEITKYEENRLAKSPQEIGQIDNPFSPGQVLTLNNNEHLFVGRRDLVQQLEESLGRGNRRPTFLLYGERRMGKTSTLRQLPKLLGARFLPIFYDLQRPELASNIVILLGTIADEIQKGMSYRGINPKKLKNEHLQKANKENEAVVYSIFDEWLKDIEYLLEQENQTVLLTFDEFEKLEEKSEYLNLHLLLDWFRGIIQNRSRVALLFSGIHTLSDIGPLWASHFVNVQSLKISFLKPEEASQLITEPTEDFPGHEIFGEVIDAIISQTGCHPFLVQAVCSILIDKLNTDKRFGAVKSDIEVVINEVLQKWWDTYFQDLWERTSYAQRICLQAIKLLGQSDQERIIHKSKLDEKTVREAITTLCKRDLVLEKQNNFQIAAPIFEYWIERNMRI